MDLFLEKIQEKTESVIKELNWDENEVNQFVKSVNDAFANRARNGEINGEPDNSLVVHPATYSGGFILFGGWTKIFDGKIPSGTRGHELYLAFGGLGVGGWNGDCDIELITEGTFEHDGKTYNKPVNFYDKGNPWESYNSGFDWFHDHVKSFMFMYLPVFAQPIPVFAYFDSNSNRIGVSVPNCSLSIGIGGGTVKVE